MRTDAVRTDFVDQHQPRTEDARRRGRGPRRGADRRDDPEVVQRLADRLVEEAHRAVAHDRRPARAVADRVGERPVRRSRRRSTRRARARRPRAGRSPSGRGIADHGARIAATACTSSATGASSSRRVGNLRRERGQVQRRRRSSCQVRTRVDGRWRRVDGRRPRHRHPGPRPRPDLRAVLPRRPGAQPRDRRHRARPLDRAPRRDEPRRRGARVVAGGRRIDVRAPHPGRRAPCRRDQSNVHARSRPNDRPCLVVEDEASFVEALTIGLDAKASTSTSPSTAPRRSSGSMSSHPTSCCST